MWGKSTRGLLKNLHFGRLYPNILIIVALSPAISKAVKDCLGVRRIGTKQSSKLMFVHPTANGMSTDWIGKKTMKQWTNRW